MRKLSLLGVSLTLLALIGVVAITPAQADPPPNRSVHYEIRRNGDTIGTHDVTFARQGERFTIDHQIRISVTILSLQAYHYNMDSRETWEGNRLLGFYANTDRNGDPLRVFARLRGASLRIRGPEGQSQVSADAVPTSPQHNVFDRPRPLMIEAEDGSLVRVSVSRATTENLQLGGRSVPCQRFEVTGGLTASLWYGPSGILVRKSLSAPDGSRVLTVLM